MTEPAIDRVPPALEGERIDRVVALVTGCTRAEAAALVDAGGVRLGSRVVTSRSRRVHAGEPLHIDGDPTPPAPRGLAPDPNVKVILPPPPGGVGVPASGRRPGLRGPRPGEEYGPGGVGVPALGRRPGLRGPRPGSNIEVPIVYVDDDVIVVDKPAGLVVHPGAGTPGGTLVQGLLAAFPDLAALAVGDAADRPGIVQRLDKGTSGLMVVARTAAAQASLVAQLSARSVERAYLALAAGQMEADRGVIDAPIGRDGAMATRMAVTAGGRHARTGYEVEQRFTDPVATTLVTCRLETGRTHQIRVHLAAIGHPVVGDERYGGPPLDGLRRPFLHAAVLGFVHPVTGEDLRFSSPLPDDLAGVLATFSAE